MYKEAFSSSVILSPALAGVLGSNHALNMRHSPLPEGLCSDVTGASTHLCEHLGTSVGTGIRRGKTEVTGHSGCTSQELVKLALSDATLALLISLNEAIED